MKNLILSLVSVFLISACANTQKKDWVWYHFELEGFEEESALARAETLCSQATDYKYGDRTNSWLFVYETNPYYVRCMKGQGFVKMKKVNL